MANEFSITTATSRFNLDPNRRAEVTVTVANATSRPIQGRVQLEVTGGGKAEWFTVQGETTRNFAVAESAQYTIQSAVPAGTAPGEYTLRLNMVGVKNPDEEFSEGPSILFTVATAPVAAAPPKRFPWLYILIGLALVAVVAVVFLLMNRQPATVATVVVPDISGQKVEDAMVSLVNAGLLVTRQDVANNEIAPGWVIAVDPAAGTSLTISSPVTITVSSGPEMVSVPQELIGKAAEEAAASLKDVRLTTVQVREASPSVAEGLVISTDPAAGTSIAIDSPVTLTVSSGPKMVAVPPDLIGKSVEEAAASLRSAELMAMQMMESSSSVAQGLVISTDPAAGTSLPANSEVELVVSSGPQMVVVPTEILGLTQADAEVALKELGFRTASSQQANSQVAEGLVISANPAPEASVPISSLINLVVSSGPEIVAVSNVTNRALADAQKALTDLGLKVVVNTELNGSVDPGNVIRTQPAAGTSLRAGETVTLAVSAPRPSAAPTGMVSFFEDTVCPSGWQERPEMKGRLLLGTTDGTYAGKTSVAPPLADKEDRKHGHLYTAALSLPQKGIAGAGGGNNDGGQAGSYPLSGSVDPSTSNLPFRQLLACEKKGESTPASGDAYPKDTIGYVTSAACPAGWQAYEEGNGRFLVPLPAGGATADVGSPIVLTPSSVDIPPHNHGLQLGFGINNQEYVLSTGSDRNLGQSGSFSTGRFLTSPSAAQEQLPYIALMVCRKVADPQPTVNSIPSAALAFTEAPACPTGWGENWISRGRFLVALPANGTPGEFGGPPLNSKEDRMHAHKATATLTLRGEGIAGSSGNFLGASASGYARNGQYSTSAVTDPASMNIPYRQLRLCKPTP